MLDRCSLGSLICQTLLGQGFLSLNLPSLSQTSPPAARFDAAGLELLRLGRAHRPRTHLGLSGSVAALLSPRLGGMLRVLRLHLSRRGLALGGQAWGHFSWVSLAGLRGG